MTALLGTFSLSRDNYRHHGKVLAAEVKAQTGLKLTPGDILLVATIFRLEKEGNSSPSLVAKAYGVTSPQITQNSQKLEVLGLIEPPQISDADRRSRIIHTTTLGAKVAAIAEKL